MSVLIATHTARWAAIRTCNIGRVAIGSEQAIKRIHPEMYQGTKWGMRTLGVK
jgi:hypothetical protein